MAEYTPKDLELLKTVDNPDQTLIFIVRTYELDFLFLSSNLKRRSSV